MSLHCHTFQKLVSWSQLLFINFRPVENSTDTLPPPFFFAYQAVADLRSETRLSCLNITVLVKYPPLGDFFFHS